MIERESERGRFEGRRSAFRHVGDDDGLAGARGGRGRERGRSDCRMREKTMKRGRVRREMRESMKMRDDGDEVKTRTGKKRVKSQEGGGGGGGDTARLSLRLFSRQSKRRFLLRTQK